MRRQERRARSAYAPGTEEFYLAKAHWAQGEHEAAEGPASAAMQRFPDQARFPALLGMTALSQGRFDEALRLNHGAMRLDPSSADAFHNLGLALLVTGRGREAVEAVEKAFSLSPIARYFFTLAKALESTGHRPEVLRMCEEYLRRSRTSDPFRKNAEERLSSLKPVQGQP